MCETSTPLLTELFGGTDDLIPVTPPPCDIFDTAQLILDDAVNVCLLDHCEVVDSTVPWPKEPISDGCDPGSLFSFELETSDIPQVVLDTVDDLLTDFGQTDVLDDTSDPLPSAGHEFPLESNLLCSTQTTLAQPNSSSIFYPGNHVNITVSEKSYSRSSGDTWIEPMDNFGSYFPDTTGEYLDSSSEASLPVEPVNSRGFLNNEDLARGVPGARLTLTLEERKMLKAMGVTLPTRFPLTRSEEKALKTVRRKIRNKLSAQASRVRHQEYVAQLERRVERRDEENVQLRRHIVSLEKDKRDLLFHVKKLRAYISKLLARDKHTTPLPMFVPSKPTAKHTRSSAQTATAAAGGTSLLLMTFLFLTWTAMVPNPTQNVRVSNSAALETSPTNDLLNIFPGRSRTLLETKVSSDESIQDTVMQKHSDRPIVIPEGTISPEVAMSASTLKSLDRASFEEFTGLNNESSAVAPTSVEIAAPSDHSATIAVHGMLTSFDL